MPCGSNLELAWESLRRVLTSKDLSDQVHVEDVVHLDVKLLPLLSEQELRALLRESLKEQGWVEQPDGSVSKDFGTATASLSPDGTAVTIRVAEKVTVTAQVQGSVSKDASKEEEKEKRKELDAAAREQLEKRAEAERARLEKEHIRELAAREPEVRGAVQEALNRTYRRALEQRARQLGEVESVQESGDVKGDYEVTLVVRA